MTPLPPPPPSPEDLAGQALGSRFDLAAALQRLRGRRSAVIYMHDNPDPDSLASAVGMKRLLENELSAPVTLALGGIIGRAENRAMVEALRIPLVPVETLRHVTFDCVAIVDSQPGTGNNSLSAQAPIDIVVDHHPARSDLKATAWLDIRPDFGATSTIVLQYLRERAIPLDAALATALFYALRTETRDLGREASNAERVAYVELVPQVDHELLYRISHPKVPREHFVALDRALRSARVYGDIVAANLNDLSYPDLVAEVADLLLSLEGARFVLCCGRYRSKVYASLRTDPGYGRAGSVMRQVVDSLGTAGGHGTMAGGSLTQPASTPEELDRAFAALVRRLHEALGRPQPAASVPLIAG